MSSDPIDSSTPLEVEQELVGLVKSLKDAGIPIRVRRVFPPTLDQLRRDLAEIDTLEPLVFHFIGHGDDDGLYFEDEFGCGQLVVFSELKNVFSGTHLSLAVLNACWSAMRRGVSLCEHLTREQIADAAVGHEDAVADGKAAQFAGRLYAELLSGESIEAACKNAAIDSRIDSTATCVGETEASLVSNHPRSQAGPGVFDDPVAAKGRLPDSQLLLGRRRESLQLASRICDKRVSVVSLAGVSGIGKTALGVAAARRWAWRFDRVVWVDAAQLRNGENLKLQLTQCLQREADVDCSLLSSQSPKDLLDRSSHLVVVDNIDLFANQDASEWHQLLDAFEGNDSKLVLIGDRPVTHLASRQQAAIVNVVTGLDSLGGYRLFQNEARSRAFLNDLWNDLMENELAPNSVVEGIVERVHGHPRLIRQAAARYQRGLVPFLLQLSLVPDFVETQMGTIVRNSIQGLGEAGKFVLPYLRYFPFGTFTLEALTACYDQSGDLPCYDPDKSPDIETIRMALRELQMAGLIQHEPESDVYLFHRLLIDIFVRNPLSKPKHARAVWNLLYHYCEFVLRNAFDFPQLDRCFWNVESLMNAAWDSVDDAESGQRRLVGYMGIAISKYCDSRSYWQVGEKWKERGMSQSVVAKEMGERNPGDLIDHSRLLRRQGKLDRSRESLFEAFRIARRSGNKDALVAVLHQLGVFEVRAGLPSRALRVLKRGLRLAERIGNDAAKSAILHEISAAHRKLGEWDKALDLLRKAREFCDPDDQHAAVVSAIDEGVILLSQGDIEDARDKWKAAAEDARHLGDRYLYASALGQLGLAWFELGNLAESRRVLSEASGIQEKIGDEAGLSRTFHQLAINLLQQGEPEEAEAYALRSINIQQSIEDWSGLIASYSQMGAIQLYLENIIYALRMQENALELARDLGDKNKEARSQISLSRIYRRQGRAVLASNALEEAVRLAKFSGDRKLLAECLHEEGIVLLKQGKHAEAAQRFQHAHEASPRTSGTTLMMLAQYEAERNAANSIKLAKRALEIYEREGNPRAADARNLITALELPGADAKESIAFRFDRLRSEFEVVTEQERDRRIQEIDAKADPEAKILHLLARFSVRWAAHDTFGCQDDIRLAQQLAFELSDKEVSGLVQQIYDEWVERGGEHIVEFDRRIHAGKRCLETFKVEQALTHFRSAVSFSQSERNAIGEQTAISFTGVCFKLQLQFGKAKEAFDESLKIAIRENRADLEAITRSRLGEISFFLHLQECLGFLDSGNVILAERSRILAERAASGDRALLHFIAETCRKKAQAKEDKDRHTQLFKDILRSDADSRELHPSHT